jgi:hypothetical protein
MPDELRESGAEDRLRDIRRHLSDPNVGFVSNFDGDAQRVIIAFAGLRGGMGPLPVFEFFQSLSKIGAKAAFYRDHDFAWYHRGVPSVGPDIDSITEHIRNLASGVDELIMIGNSGGAYASLLFSSLLGDEVYTEAHAFSPPTFIDPDLRRRYSDARWQNELDVVVEGGFLDRRFADLYPVVSTGRGPFNIYYARHHAFDRIHAEHLGRLHTVTLHPIESDIHTPIRHLRDTGWLHTFLEELAHRPPVKDRRQPG